MSDEAPSTQPASPRQTARPDSLIVGQIVAPFGVKGEMKVNVLTEFPDRFKRLEAVILAPYNSIAPDEVPPRTLDPATNPPGALPEGHPFRSLRPKEPTSFKIEATRYHGGQLMLKVEGVDDPESAASLRGYWVMVPGDEIRRLPRGSFYLYEIMGLDVYTTEGDHIGRIYDVLTYSANDVYVVRGEGVTDPTGELLVPALEAIVKEISPEKGRMTILPPAEWT